MIASLNALILRDLDRLSKEVDAFENDAALWVKRPDITNTAGNLALHLCGNLQHFIGHVLGGSDYTRDREYEFSASGLTKAVLKAEIEATKAAISKALNGLPATQLSEEYPIQVFGEPMTIKHFLLHLIGHLNYHLGQINYYRRLK